MPASDFPKTLSLAELPQALQELPNPPKQLFICGDQSLLSIAPKVAIVGTRKPNPYTKSLVASLAAKISRCGGVVVSGGALGVDIIAHSYAFPRTIMLSPSSLDIIYPKSNAKMIAQMMREALVMSEYERGYQPHHYSFLERNRLVIALSDYVVIPQADKMSGSMQSARIARELQKPLFVFPHRLGESEGTQMLLSQQRAQGIYNINDFVESTLKLKVGHNDEFLAFCASNPSFEEVYERFGEKVYEYELMGKIAREGSNIVVL